MVFRGSCSMLCIVKVKIVEPFHNNDDNNNNCCCCCYYYYYILFLHFQSVELISSDMSSDHTPSLVSPQGTRRYERSQDAGVMETVGPLPESMEGTEWAVLWRMTVRQVESGAVPLPMPKSTQCCVSMKDMFKTRSSPQQQAPFHRYCIVHTVCRVTFCLSVKKANFINSTKIIHL